MYTHNNNKSDAVTKYLRRHRHVKSFEYAPQSAGGSGCTIATLG